jgi:hypothetical protein
MTKLTKATFLAGSKFSPVGADTIVYQFVGTQGLPVGNKGYIGQWGPFVNERRNIADVTEIRNSGFTAGNMVLNQFLNHNFTYEEFALID